MRPSWKVIGSAAVFLTAGCSTARDSATSLPSMPIGNPAPATMVRGIDPANLDTSVAPCDDFYKYANGGWLAHNPVPPDRSVWSSYHEVAERTEGRLRQILEQAARQAAVAPEGLEGTLGKFYSSCMDSVRADTETYRPLAAELERLASLSERSQIPEAMTRLARWGIGVPFWLVANSDPRDSERMMARTWQNGLVLPGPEDYLDDDPASKGMGDAYLDYAAALFRLTGHDEAEARRVARQLLEFESDLAGASMTRLEMRNPHAIEHPMTVQQVRALMPHFDWSGFLAGVGAPAFNEMNVSQPDYLREVDRLLDTAPLGLWSLYLRWRLLDDLAPWLGSEFFDASFEFSSRLSGSREAPPRWRRCLHVTNDTLGQALGRLYAEEGFPPRVKRRAEEMTANLRAAFRESLEAIDWMGPKTRHEALAKLARLEARLGYPDSIPDYSRLELPEGSFIVKLIAVAEFEVDRDLLKIGRPVDRDEWFMLPQNIGGGYVPSWNELQYPAAKFQPPFFDAEADDAVNYGAIGATISHEFIHAFDDEGRQYDASGNLRDWWTMEDAERFKILADVLVEQFDGYIAVDDVHVHGRLTLGENIADLGGVGLAYRALERSLRGKDPPSIDGFTARQRFFLSWAQNWRTNMRPEQAHQRARNNVHAPPRWRTNGPLSHMPEFAMAFGCETGDPMVRSGRDTVRIW